MIKEHPDLGNVSDDTIIWKYMTIEKFLFLIREKKLHFQRSDCFSDKAEGTLSVLDKKLFRVETDKGKEYYENDRKRNYLNCWINSPYELSLMWDVYAPKGVAIKSTVQSLKSSVNDKRNIYIAPVKYIDYNKESSHDDGDKLNGLRPYFTKRNYFEQEKEIRLLYFFNCGNKELTPDSFQFDCDPSKLINEVYVSPKADDYVTDLIEKELKKSSIKAKVVKSQI